MRNLTVKREKTFVGSISKVKLYVPDEEKGELTIQGVSCRLLGELKNGEEKTFAIETGETVLYAIADKLSKDYCNDSYCIPAGEEDLHISGKCQFSLGNNTFCFAGQDTLEKQQKRKKNGRKGLLIFILCAALGGIAGSFIGKVITGQILQRPPAEKVFQAEEMRITLTEEFEAFQEERFTATFASKQVGVLVLKEPFSLAYGSKDLTVEEYGHLVISANGITGTKLCTEGGLCYFEFQRANPEDNRVYSYFAAVYKSENAFWLVQLSTQVAQYKNLRDTLEAWARTVTFE